MSKQIFNIFDELFPGIKNATFDGYSIYDDKNKKIATYNFIDQENGDGEVLDLKGNVIATFDGRYFCKKNSVISIGEFDGRCFLDSNGNVIGDYDGDADYGVINVLRSKNITSSSGRQSSYTDDGIIMPSMTNSYWKLESAKLNLLNAKNILADMCKLHIESLMRQHDDLIKKNDDNNKTR